MGVNSLRASSESDAAGVHLEGVGVVGSLVGRELLSSISTVGKIASAVQVGHLVEDGTGLIQIIIGAVVSEQREAPESTVGAGHDSVVAGDGVGNDAVAAVVVVVGAGDAGAGALDSGNIVVDRLDLTLLRGVHEPGSEVVVSIGSSRGSSLRHGNGVVGALLESADLVAAARGGVGNITLLDARVEGGGTLGVAVAKR